ncbi:hypothetical protein Y032_0098g3086 [Ancylostoma ceylanicum]|uniref:Uncharacterized protein n=1 Tax=Ancylostoma ceylanicum TaxID=53326 RepID=A0A016TIC6_9BILA|nr:hypothetical protein Y032_0098g3086 [Ancylostoma ceylanicum]
MRLLIAFSKIFRIGFEPNLKGHVVVNTEYWLQSFQKILASGIHRPSAEPCHASYALSYVVRRGSVDVQCIVVIMHRRGGADQQTGGECRRQVFFGTTLGYQ